MRALEGTFHALECTRECALLMPEQGALDQPFRQCCAIQLNERLVAAVALVVQRAGEQLLARTRLALQQHRRARRRRHGNRLHQPPHHLAVADDLPLVPELHHLAAQRIVLATEAHQLQRLLHRQLQLLRTHWLRDVVHCAGLDACHRMLDRRVTGQHDQRHVVSFATQQRQELQAGQTRHPVVGNHQVDVAAGQHLQRLGHVASADRRVSGLLQRVFENQADTGFVIDIQDRGHARGAAGRNRHAGHATRPDPSAEMTDQQGQAAKRSVRYFTRVEPRLARARRTGQMSAGAG